MTFDTWQAVVTHLRAEAKKRKLTKLHVQRLVFEVTEVEKQGSERTWLERINSGVKFDTNKNNLIIPWLAGILTGDADCNPCDNRKSPMPISADFKYINGIAAEHGSLPHDIKIDPDKPDIDLDCLPEAREAIKTFAAERFGAEKVANVGTWTTFLFKNALGDTFVALGLSRTETEADYRALKLQLEPGKNLAIGLTSQLPEDVNELKNGGVGLCTGSYVSDGITLKCETEHAEEVCPKCGSATTETPTLKMLLRDHPLLKAFYELSEDHAKVVHLASRLIGCYRNQGKHAGAIIISDRELIGNVPMVYDAGSDQWNSMWTEGRDPQLSKFGYIKWDILGLKNLQYVYESCRMIEENHGISFGDNLSSLEDIDPGQDRAGSYWKDGVKYPISLSDPKILQTVNERRVDGIFQFDSELQRQVLSNGVRNFNDLLSFNALGHPGPLQSIPDYVSQRDDDSSAWKKDLSPEMERILGDTYGIIIYQEQLTDLWIAIAGFTSVEAQDFRKAVAKKNAEKLKAVEAKWIAGATPVIGADKAREWHGKMVTFARYAFNRSHAVAYCLLAYKCLWLKTYYGEEFWASVLADCYAEKLPRYIESARRDGVKFGEIDINRMTAYPAAHSGKNMQGDTPTVAIGLTNLKKIGEATAEAVLSTGETPEGGFKDIDSFVTIKNPNRPLMERLIKLGSFVKLHPNRRATWAWYLHEYSTGEVEFDGEKIKATALRQKHHEMLLEKTGRTESVIAAERQAHIDAYFLANPKRKKLPKSLENYKPKTTADRDSIMALYPDDYSLQQRLDFEQEFLGYYWSSVCDLYHMSEDCTIERAKQSGRLEGIITNVIEGTTRLGDKMLKVFISDGSSRCLVFVWSSDISNQDPELLVKDSGVRLSVQFDYDRETFTLRRGAVITSLITEEFWQEMANSA